MAKKTLNSRLERQNEDRAQKEGKVGEAGIRVGTRGSGLSSWVSPVLKHVVTSLNSGWLSG